LGVSWPTRWVRGNPPASLTSGLGKTIQVIAFLAHLKEKKIKGPHMIYVPYVAY
jgi:hypothetical protein